MTTFQNDMMEAQEIRQRAEHVLDHLRRTREAITRLSETRRKLEETDVLSFEEYLREQQHLHGHMPDRESEQVKNKYEEYSSQTRRMQDEVRSQLEQRRTNLVEMHHEFAQRVSSLKSVIEKMHSRVREADRIASEIGTFVERGSLQMSLEQLNALKTDLVGIAWMKDQW